MEIQPNKLSIRRDYELTICQYAYQDE